MRRARLLIAVAALIATTAFAEPQIAPDWSLQDGDGATFTFDADGGDKHRLVLFWATWCPYCKALMPHLQSVVHQYEDIDVLAISVFENGDPAKYVKQTGFQFRVLVEGDEVAKQYGVKGTPGLFLVNPQGQVIFDLANVLARPLETGNEKLSNRQKAGRRAPFWAAELRLAIDAALNPQSNPSAKTSDGASAGNAGS